jgi:hypothetical protein
MLPLANQQGEASMRRTKIKEGQRFGRLVYIQDGDGENNGRRSAFAECDCGKVIEVRLSHLTGGQIQSCGCFRRDLFSRHKMSRSKIYKRWAAMLDRCRNLNAPNYRHYGGRGIQVCERWNDFACFLADMGMPPAEDSELDRVDNNLGYEPSNVRWANASIQLRNQRKRPDCSSQYRGVSSTIRHGKIKWIAGIKVGPRRRYLGIFATEEEAARSYDAVARLYRGFTLNFPTEGP